MIQFWFALLVFIGSHAVGRTPLHAYIVRHVGEKDYLSVYSALSIALLSWLVYAAIHAPRISLWPWMHGLYWIPNLLMPIAFILLVSGFVVPNPLSLIPRDKGFNPHRPPMIIAVTRHPILWGFLLWSASHIFPNGEFPLAFMFFIFALFAYAGIKMIDKKRQRMLGMAEWQKLSGNAPNIPFSGKSFWRGKFSLGQNDLVGITGGLLLYVAFFYLHPILFNVTPMPPLPYF
ncbi:MAG: NnrU family protein [Micavibrio sp.]